MMNQYVYHEGSKNSTIVYGIIQNIELLFPGSL